MADVDVTYQPLTQWPASRPRTAAVDREDAKFKVPGYYEKTDAQGDRWIGQRAMPLTRTLEDLDRELAQVDARDVVIQIDVTNKQDMREDVCRDGRIRDDARVHSPAVVITFKRAGTTPLVFACDYFKRWQDNLRALTLGLEALRKLERYHIAQTGDQYRGWQALPASTTTAFNVDQAAAFLSRMTGLAAPEISKQADIAKDAIRAAANATHPDRGGSTGTFQLVQEAKRVLGAHFGVQL